MSLILDGSNGITFPNSSTQAVGFYGFKNRIINGAMVIDQRNAGASVAVSATGIYTVDRFRTASGSGAWGSAVFSFQQNKGSVTPPTGFSNYVGVAPTTADASPSANTVYSYIQAIEGNNVSDLAWGTANAKAVTLSFWVYSNLTGTFGGSVSSAPGSAAYIFSYSIPVANTWTQISINITGPTSGTWAATTAASFSVRFSLGAGSTWLTSSANAWNYSTQYEGVTGQQQVCASTSNYLYITGVQLEAGSTATSFDYRPYGTELALCQRYYFSSGGTHEYLAFLDGNNADYPSLQPLTWPVTMRSTPSVNTFTFGTFGYNSGSAGASFTPSGGTVAYYGNGQCGYIAINSISNYPGAAQTSKVGYWSGISFGLTSEL